MQLSAGKLHLCRLGWKRLQLWWRGLWPLHQMGVLQGAKLRQAILKLGHERKINYTRWNEEVFSDKCDHLIRVVLSHFRLLKQKQDEYQKCMRKATEAEQTAIDQVLANMNLEVDDSVLGVSQAPAKAPPTSSPPAAEERIAHFAVRPFSLSGDDSKIFQRILAKKDSNEETSTALVLAAAPTSSSSSWEATSRPARTSSAPVLGKRRTSSGMHFLPEEEDPLVGLSPVVEKSFQQKHRHLRTWKKLTHFWWLLWNKQKQLLSWACLMMTWTT